MAVVAVVVVVGAGCAVPRAWDVSRPLSCGGSTEFDRSALDRPPVPAGDPDLAVVLARYFMAVSPVWSGEPTEPLHVLARTDTHVTFGVGGLPDLDAAVPTGTIPALLELEWRDGTWRFDGASFPCRLHTVIDGLRPSSWRLDPAFPPPGPDTTELHLLVTEINCASGTPATGRIRPPALDWTDDALLVGITVTYRGGDQTCQGNPETPFTFELGAPLGARTLYDSGPYPALPLGWPRDGS